MRMPFATMQFRVQPICRSTRPHPLDSVCDLFRSKLKLSLLKSHLLNVDVAEELATAISLSQEISHWPCAGRNLRPF